RCSGSTPIIFSNAPKDKLNSAALNFSRRRLPSSGEKPSYSRCVAVWSSRVPSFLNTHKSIPCAPTSLEVAISSSKDNLSYAELITHIGLFSLANIYVSILIFVWVNINKKDSISADFEVYFDINRLINVVVQEGIVRTNLRFAIIKRQSKPRDLRL